jgi:DNA helicase II / ATP-dependent DNA helicase PcrA
MKARIGKLAGNGVESKLITGIAFYQGSSNIGTFHSICRRYLVKYGHLIDLPKNFGIADTDDRYQLP